jgi:crotonobetainyl-CoA:carnitine CoA-transferase CaiB-like acyl-CoA transferase
VSGPVGTSLLGALGAEVIKIENTQGRSPRQPRDSLMQRNSNFMELNRNKLGVALNLNRPEAREAFLKLVAISDVVIDNFSPRVMRNFKLEYEDLVKVKPDIIVARMPAFGTSGPLRDQGAFGPGIDAMSGLSHLTGYADSTPLKPGNYYCDYNAGVHAALAVMTAIFARRRTGRGQFIEVAMRDGESQLIGEYILDYVMNGRVESRAANRHPTMAPHNVYPALGEDRWLSIAVGHDDEWAALCRVMGKPSLLNDARFSTVLARKRNEAEVDAIVQAWTREQDPLAAMHLLQREGIPASAVHTSQDIALDAQFEYRGTFQEVETREGGNLRLGRAAWLAKHATIELKRGPEHGEHTRKVLQELLGYSGEEVEAMEAADAIVLHQYST